MMDAVQLLDDDDARPLAVIVDDVLAGVSLTATGTACWYGMAPARKGIARRVMMRAHWWRAI